jgi:hypothetical protein
LYLPAVDCIRTSKNCRKSSAKRISHIRSHIQEHKYDHVYRCSDWRAIVNGHLVPSISLKSITNDHCRYLLFPLFRSCERHNYQLKKRYRFQNPVFEHDRCLEIIQL